MNAAAPYFRIFNAVTQGKKFDPEGHFVRRWLPELANVPNKSIHTPWEMSAGIYPNPVWSSAFTGTRRSCACENANPSMSLLVMRQRQANACV